MTMNGLLFVYGSQAFVMLFFIAYDSAQSTFF